MFPATNAFGNLCFVRVASSKCAGHVSETLCFVFRFRTLKQGDRNNISINLRGSPFYSLAALQLDKLAFSHSHGHSTDNFDFHKHICTCECPKKKVYTFRFSFRFPCCFVYLDLLNYIRSHFD